MRNDHSSNGTKERTCDVRLTSRLTDEEARAGADLMKALADPARLQILDILSQQQASDEVCACEFEGWVGLRDPKSGQRPKQPTISHHLRVLRNAGLIEGEKRGLWIYYQIRTERLEEVQSLLNSLVGSADAGTGVEEKVPSPCC